MKSNSPNSGGPQALKKWRAPSHVLGFEIHRWLRATSLTTCHLAHPQQITKPPRELIHALAGANFVELPDPMSVAAAPTAII